MGVGNVSDNSTSSCSSESSDDEPILQIINVAEILMSHPKNEQYYETTVDLCDEDEFKQQFRVSRKVAYKIASLLEESESFPKFGTGFDIIPARKYILIFLWFAGYEAVGFRDIADRFNVSISKLHGILELVTSFISGLSSKFITWPSEDEKAEIINSFDIMGFSKVLGVIDGSHIEIDTPSYDPISYFNRKKYYSIHMQAVCDHKRRFRDVFIGFPGSVHDSRVFRNSTLFGTLEETVLTHV